MPFTEAAFLDVFGAYNSALWPVVAASWLVMYPFIGLALDLDYPRAPLFAVPCPTTILTAGLLLTANGLPRLIGVGPALWAVVGSSAALALGVEADTALIACAVLLLPDIAGVLLPRRSPA